MMKALITCAAAVLLAPAPAGRSVGPRQAGESSAADDSTLAMPAVGDHWLRIIDSRTFELNLITTEPPDGRPRDWDFVDAQGTVQLPAPGRFNVRVNGESVTVSRVGFKRRVLYAPLKHRDLRVACEIYLRTESPLPESASVEVTNPDGTLWTRETAFKGRADRLRWSPAIHVNQVGYAPDWPKKAIAGYYLGSLGELQVAENQEFSVVDATTGRRVFGGRLRLRPDKGFPYAVLPYQKVMVADFSDLHTPGAYRLAVPGLGASYPFLIDEGCGAAAARTYALGLYHQRCGAKNDFPFTRFVHDACHVAPALVLAEANRKMQQQLAGESANYKDNPRHTAPQLKDVNVGLYPFVNQGTVDVSGGHHDAGDYSKYTINSAALIHTLIFAADVFPGVGDLDNLGIPESGDGKSDLLQEAKWEADFLVRMQDADGGFYFLVYPRDRAYENNVLPDHGDPQVVFPKTTAVTAAAVAALAQAASSPRFKSQFPGAASRYLSAAKRGWEFVERAQARFGRDGSYQKITHYGDLFMHDDEIVWALTELTLATGESKYHERLLKEFDPASRDTRRWTWVRMCESYGAAIRGYAFAEQSGRVRPGALNPALLAKCRYEILACGDEQARRAADCAYGTSFPEETKRVRSAGWYFPMEQAFDLAVADALSPKPEYKGALISNLNYEFGTNPNNVTFLTGLGWRRQREVVHQYHMNDRRVLPPTGIPLGAIQGGFAYLEPYKRELGALNFPPDGDRDTPYAFYDRWGDSFNVTTEFVAPIQARGLACTANLMAKSAIGKRPWRSARARITGLPARTRVGTKATAALSVEGMDLSRARIVWESAGQEPAFGKTRTITFWTVGSHWVEAEAQLPDGRRVFAAAEVAVSSAPVK